ncbi:pilus assembly protein PilW [Vibrio gallaecicus]|uniref:Pilus assembly protein PilW n=1 Tax=Vibrio gallaecicus TaxID=552386 RepID=A0ABV4NDJ7_9VIBR
MKLKNRRCCQKGTSLIEMMIASTLGIISIGIIGSIFITGQKIAKDKSLELLLLQSITSTTQIMKEDIQRAGFDGGGGTSVKLSGATNTIHIDSELIGFAYFHEVSGANKVYSNILYKREGDDLKVCEKKSTQLLTVSNISPCYFLLDENQMKINDFSITQINLGSEGVSSAMVTIHLGAHLAGDTSLSKSITAEIKQRNWWQ